MGRKKLKPEKPLTETQKKAVAMYYDYERVVDIAAACGVHRSTIYRWTQLRNFRKEWQRIDRNWRRKFERREAKRRAEEDAYWEKKQREAEEKLHEIGAKITKKPGKDWYKAWNEYEKAICRGRTLSQLMDAIFNPNYKPRKGRRH